MNFGTYLKTVLDKRNVNISQLAQKTGIKSKNTFYRLFENYYSYDKTKEITDKIMSAVDISNGEKQQIYELMEMCRIKQHELEAFALLEKLYKTPDRFTCKKFENGECLWQRDDCLGIFMFLGHTSSEFPALAAKEIFESDLSCDVSLDHYINFSKSDMNTAGAIYSTITLSEYEGYSCFESEMVDFPNLMGFVKLKTGAGSFVVSNNGTYAETELSEEFYNFMLSRCMTFDGKPLKQKRGKVTDYAEIMAEFSVTEINDVFSFEGIFCFGDIPYDTMFSLLKDADYLGLPPDSPYIQTLIKATMHRYDLRAGSSTSKSYILSQTHMDQFFSTGRTVDHPSFFRSLTSDEIKGMLDYFADIGERFRYRFFKPGFQNCCMECGLVANTNIFIWSAKQAYSKDHFQTIITHPKAVKLFTNFCRYFWDFCTLSPKESKQIFNDTVNKFLNTPQD